MLFRLSANKKVYLPIEDILSLGKLREILWIQKSLKLSGTEAILDVACGTGFWTRRIARRARIAFGVDIRPGKLSPLGGRSKANTRFIATAAELKGNTRFVAAAAERLPFSAKSFDKVMSVCALEHFQSDEDALAEINRVLADRGVLAMTVDSLSHPAVDADYRQWHSAKYFCNHYYTLDRMKALLDGCGFELLDYRFILSSRTSYRLLRFFQRNTRQRAILVPFLLAISLAADYLADSQCGMILAVCARKRTDFSPKTWSNTS